MNKRPSRSVVLPDIEEYLVISVHKDLDVTLKKQQHEEYREFLFKGVNQSEQSYLQLQNQPVLFCTVFMPY